MQLTKEQVEAMPAGREMDALVAEHVLGIEFHPYNSLDSMGYRSSPSYSTDIAAAWEVVEKLCSDGIEVEVVGTRDWICDLERTDRCLWQKAETAPLAICRAALLWMLESKP